VAGELARAAGLPVPEIVFVELEPEIARTEPDPEIQDLIRASAGLNLALDYLPSAVTFDPLAFRPAPDLASRIVWLDGFVSNVDRTARNSNLMVWHEKLWLIDHGAALYFHHHWDGYMARSTSPFALIKDHVLLPFATDLVQADVAMTAALTPDVIDAIVTLIPDDWLEDDPQFADKAAHRQAYRDYLANRLQAPRAFHEEALRARSLHV
jgi:hypothetical protein